MNIYQSDFACMLGDNKRIEYSEIQGFLSVQRMATLRAENLTFVKFSVSVDGVLIAPNLKVVKNLTIWHNGTK